jgi:hypothetical protein
MERSSSEFRGKIVSFEIITFQTPKNSKPKSLPTNDLRSSILSGIPNNPVFGVFRGLLSLVPTTIVTSNTSAPGTFAEVTPVVLNGFIPALEHLHKVCREPK